MKFSQLVAGLLFMMYLVGCSEAPVSETVVSSFDIEGMTCEMGCAKAIESTLAELPGVKSAEVNFEAKSAQIEFDKSACSKDQIISSVENLGGGDKYSVLNYNDSKDLNLKTDSDVESSSDNSTSSGVQVLQQLPIEVKFPNIFDFIVLH
jgi:copper chaperone CopZ